MRPEHGPIDYDGISDDGYGLSSDEETEPVPQTTELLNQEQIFAQIALAIELTRQTGQEHCFMACFDPAGQIMVNELQAGSDVRIKTNDPAFGAGHLKGRGFHLPEGYTPFMIFHTHAKTNPYPSLEDLIYFHSIAEQNYNLSSNSDRYWVNPVNIISDGRGEIGVYQYSPETVLKLDDDDLIEGVADAVIKIGQQLGVEKWSGEKLASVRGFSSKNFLVGMHQGKVAMDYPDYVVQHPEKIPQIYNAVGLNMAPGKKYSDSNLLEAVRAFEICQKWD